MPTVIPWWMKVIAVVLLIGALFAAKATYDKVHYDEGWNARDKSAKADEARIESESRTKLEKKTADAIKAERTLRDQLDANETQRLKENADHEKAKTALLARVRVGVERLSIVTGAGSISGCSAGQNSSIAGGPSAETRTNLLPGTTERIFSIAERSAIDVRDYNAVVDAYNAVREICNRNDK